MAIEDKDINELKKELETLAKNVSSIGDSVRVGVREGIKDGNSDLAKKTRTENDADLAEKAQSRIILRQKEDFEKTREIQKTSVKTPEQITQEKAANAQFKTNEYLDQLTKLIKDNNETLNKPSKSTKPSGDSIGDSDRKKKSGSDSYITSSGMKGEDLVGKLFKGISGTFEGIKEVPGNMKRKVEGAADWIHGIGSGEGIKSKIAGGVDWVKDVAGGRQDSADRQKQLEITTKEINKEKLLLSAEEAELDKLKKQRGKNRDKKAIEELDNAIEERKSTIAEKAKVLGSLTSEEYLYQKGKQDKNYKLKGRDKDLVLNQMRDNVASSVTSDLETPKSTSTRGSTGIGTGVGGIGSESIIVGLNKLEKSLNAIEKNTKTNTQTTAINALSKNLISQKSLLSQLDKSVSAIESKSTGKLNADTKLSKNPAPTTFGEYISGIYTELKKANELNGKPKLAAAEAASDEGGGIMGMMGKILPALGGLAPMMGSIAAALPAIAVAAGGAYLLKKTYDMTEQSTEGTTVGDVGAGIGGFVSGKGFSKSLEDRQVDRVTAIHKKEGDKTVIEGAKTLFDRDQAPIFAPYKKYMSDGDIEGLKDKYIDYRVGNSTYIQYKIDRNKLLKQAKEQQLGESSVDSEFAQLTGDNASQTKPSTSDKGQGSQPKVNTQTSMSSMGKSSGMDQLTAMTIQAKLIATEMLNMQKNPDYINQQKAYMKENGKQFATSLVGND
jgi:hypothetical protein